MTGYTDPSDRMLVGSFNWTFSLGENLAVRVATTTEGSHTVDGPLNLWRLQTQVPEHEFPMDADLGVWSWSYDEEQNKGTVRIYQRVSKDYPWLCTYFGADSGRGVKANQACRCFAVHSCVQSVPRCLLVSL